MGNDNFFRPVSGFDLPRFAGVPSFMRLPHVGDDNPQFAAVDIGIVGVPGIAVPPTGLVHVMVRVNCAMRQL